MVHDFLETLIPKRAQIVPLVTTEERTLYEVKILQPNNLRLQATSEDNFRFDILGTPKSAWNKSAARIFAGLAIRQLVLPNNLQMFNAISKAFETYLYSIIRRYKISLKSAEQKEHIRSNFAHYGRKYQVCLNFAIECLTLLTGFSFSTDADIFHMFFSHCKSTVQC